MDRFPIDRRKFRLLEAPIISVRKSSNPKAISLIMRIIFKESDKFLFLEILTTSSL